MLGGAETVAPAIDPQVLATRAFVQARDHHIDPFLQYRIHITYAHKTDEHDYRYDVLERMADHEGRFTALTTDGTPSQDIHVWRTLVSPGAFLNAVAEEPAAPSTVQTIGRVIVLPYTVRLAGEEPAGTCAHAEHLVLAPRGNPSVHKLRDIWVEPETARICRASLAMTVRILSRETVLVDVGLNEQQFVDSWHLAGKGHTLFGTYALVAGATMTDITNVPTADERLFKK